MATAWTDTLTDADLQAGEKALAEHEAQQQRIRELELRRGFRRHPVATLLRDAALGHLPTDAELDALQLTTRARAKVAKAAREAHDLQAPPARELQAADELAEGVAQEVWSSLPEIQQDPSFYDDPEPDDIPDDPAALAAGVTRY